MEKASFDSESVHFITKNGFSKILGSKNLSLTVFFPRFFAPTFWIMKVRKVLGNTEVQNEQQISTTKPWHFHMPPNTSPCNPL